MIFALCLLHVLKKKKKCIRLENVKREFQKIFAPICWSLLRELSNYGRVFGKVKKKIKNKALALFDNNIFKTFRLKKNPSVVNKKKKNRTILIRTKKCIHDKRIVAQCG